eukprot:350127_1
MGISSSLEDDDEMPQPFTHKHKVKGLECIRGPLGRNKFVVQDDGLVEGEAFVIKFRYNIQSDDDWQWEYTVHPDEHIWYSVKDEYYQILARDINKHPYNIIINKDTIIPVNIHCYSKQSSIDEKSETDDVSSPTSSAYSYDPRTPRFHVPLPPQYDTIRTILATKDPIPPSVLREYHLSTNAYEQALQSQLMDCAVIKCRFATKDLGSGGVGRQLKKHPVLMFFEMEPERIEDVVWVLHLVKDISTLKAKVELNPKLWNSFCRDGGRWNVSDQIVELESISILDVAKWCVQYEKKHPDYSEFYNNCRKFMLELSTYISVKWDDIMLMEKVWYTMCPEKDNGSGYTCFSQ